MSLPRPLRTLLRGYDRVHDTLALAARRRVGYFGPLRIVGYRGYGTQQRVHVHGRVLADRGGETAGKDHGLVQIVDVARLFATDEVPEARVRVRFQNRVVDVQADTEGFFEAELTPSQTLDPDVLWHPVELELLAPRPHVDQPSFRFTTALQVPRRARFGVISDLDDTVLRTGGDSRLRQVRIVLLNDARSRTPLPGVGELYRALQDEHARALNPIFYVSRALWNLYEHFEDFLQHQDIPHGTMFLQDPGPEQNDPRGETSFKVERITTILQTYPDLPFLLIGDTTRQDPQDYRTLVERHPEQIAAVYLRTIEDAEEDGRARDVAGGIEAMGVPAVLVRRTIDAAEHARRMGWIADWELPRIREACRRDEARPEPAGPLMRRLLGA